MAPNIAPKGTRREWCDCGLEHDDDVLHEHEADQMQGLQQGPQQPGPAFSGLGWRFPDRKKGLFASVDEWLEGRQQVDGAEGLWRVGDNLYDLTPFMERHPGGRDWLQLTKGMDITEVFYLHHISDAAELILPKFLVRPAAAPRNSPFTFHREGFYMQLRARTRKLLESIPKEVMQEARGRSKMVVDSLAVATLATCVLAGFLNSFPLAVVAGLLLSLTAGGAHNFFHQGHNWRRYLFELSFMSSKEWMVSHALSHHIFTNTMQDLEITFFEPVIAFLPYPNKNVLVRFASWVYCYVLYAMLAHGQVVKRLLAAQLQWTDAVGLVVPACILLGGASPVDAWLLWTCILIVSSLYFAFQGLTAGHHHPDKYHEGDALGPDMDYGLMQLAASSDVSGVRSKDCLAMCITHFGDHLMHHFFPAVDQAVLRLLEPALLETLVQFGLPAPATVSFWDAFRGKYRQMARIAPARDANPATLPLQ